MIASRPCIQAALPHFLVCSESQMPKLVARAFKALPPSRLQLLCGKSSWVTAETFVTILTELQKALQPWLPAVKPILLLDCACPHLPKKVLSFAQKRGLQLLFVPSCGTSLLQPLDIFAFAAFKIYLRRKYQEHRRTALDGHPDLLAWVWQLGQAGQDFFGKRKWAHAFAGVGCGGDVSQLHSSLKNFMGNPVSFPLPAKPTDAELALIWPKRRKMSYAAAYLFWKRPRRVTIRAAYARKKLRQVWHCIYIIMYIHTYVYLHEYVYIIPKKHHPLFCPIPGVHPPERSGTTRWPISPWWLWTPVLLKSCWVCLGENPCGELSRNGWDLIIFIGFRRTFNGFYFIV